MNTNNKGGEVATATPKKYNSSIDSLIDSPINESRNAKLDQRIPSVQPPVIEKKNQKPAIENKIANAIASNKPENKNNLPKERKVNDKPIADPTEATDVIAAVPNNEIQKIESAKTNNLLDNSSVTKSTSPSFANISDISDENDRFEKDKDKGGIKEFLRKTTRVFERRTRIQTTTDDNKLLLGAFAVSLK